jgi:hypothetical protein
MENLQILENYGVFLRACEGIPLLVLMVAFLAISWCLQE